MFHQVFNTLTVESAFSISLFVLIIIPSFTEEIFFRGFILNGFAKNYSAKKAIIVSALLFGVIHLNPWQFFSAFIIGIISGWICVKTNSILPSIYIHLFNNTIYLLTSRFKNFIPVQGFNSNYKTSEVFQPLWFDMIGIAAAGIGIVLLIKAMKITKPAAENVSALDLQAEQEIETDGDKAVVLGSQAEQDVENGESTATVLALQTDKNLENSEGKIISKQRIILDILMPILSIGSSILVYGCIFLGEMEFSPLDTISFVDIIVLLLPFYALYNIIRVFLLNKKKNYGIMVLLEILEFLILNIVISLIPSSIIWFNRDNELLKIIDLQIYNFGFVFRCLFMLSMLISFIIILAVNTKYLIQINKLIYYCLMPLKSIVLFMLLIFNIVFTMLEGTCVWDVMADTQYSDNFNIYNIDKIETGMTMEEITGLIGDPLYKSEPESENYSISWTGDGKAKWGDYAWFSFRIEFENNKATKIIKRWMGD